MHIIPANSECLSLNREIAYKGIIGKRRQAFCLDHIKRKKAVIKDMEQEIVARIKDTGEMITCHKGCSSCCVAYIEANLAECEAIVYYLYQNEGILSLYLEQYPKWRAEIREYGDLFIRCEQVLREIRNGGQNEKANQELSDALFLYKMQNIPCPFLYDNACSIHEVRPFTCASHQVTTPPDWCSPLNPQQPRIYKSEITGRVSDPAFYYGSQASPIILFMPLVVNKLLKCGYYYLSEVTFSEWLWKEVTRDTEVMASMQSWQYCLGNY